MSDCVAVVSVYAANVRNEPRTIGTKIVGIARRDDRLPVHEISEPDADNYPWVRVTLTSNNLQGWLRGDLVQLKGDCSDTGVLSISVPATPEETETPDSETNVPTPEASNQAAILPGDCRGEVKVARVNVRSKPDRFSDRLGSLKRGVAFVVEEISREDADGYNWYKLEYEDQPGWIREDLVTITGDCHDAQTHEEVTPAPTPSPSPEPAPTPTPPPESDIPTEPVTCMAKIGPFRVNVRSQATTLSNNLGQAEADSFHAVQGVTDPQADGYRWIQIDFEGQTGFVRSDLASLEGDCSAYSTDDRLPQPAAVRVTQGYRPANNPQHYGLDFGTPEGTELRVSIPATVVRSLFCTNCTGNPPNVRPASDQERQQIFRDPAWGYGYGHHVILSHNFADLPASTRTQLLNRGASPEDKVFVLYAHLSRLDVEVNQVLEPDKVIGLSGNTGNSTGAHLHMEVGFGSSWGQAQKVNPNLLFAVS